MDYAVHGVTMSWTQLSDFHFHLSSTEKACLSSFLWYMLYILHGSIHVYVLKIIHVLRLWYALRSLPRQCYFLCNWSRSEPCVFIDTNISEKERRGEETRSEGSMGTKAASWNNMKLQEGNRSVTCNANWERGSLLEKDNPSWFFSFSSQVFAYQDWILKSKISLGLHISSNRPLWISSD